MTLQVILGILLRHALTAMGVSTAVVAGETINQVAGLAAAGIGLALSAIDKRGK